MFRTRSLFFAYNKHTSFHFPDIDLEAGENILVLGESGIGKTTLINLIMGLLRPTEGTISCNGINYSDLDLSSISNYSIRYKFVFFCIPDASYCGCVHSLFRMCFPTEMKNYIKGTV